MTRTTKLISTAVFAAIAVVSVGVMPAQAATLTAGQIQAVVTLLQSFGVDATAVASIQQTLGSAQVSTTTGSTTAVNASLIGFLRLGDEGDRVAFLQALLAADPSIYPEALITGYFGPLTEKALKRYQKKHGFEQVGFIGPKTLKKLSDDLDENEIALEDDDDDDGDGKRGKRVCAIVPPGHLIAPGWMRKHAGENKPVVPACQTLPPGIAKKLPASSSATTTPPTTDTTAPTITEVEVESIEATSAEVKWKTSEDATSNVRYGTATPLDLTTALTVSSDTLRNSHDLELDGLTASTIYYYVVVSADAAGNTATSSQASFTTLAS